MPTLPNLHCCLLHTLLLLHRVGPGTLQPLQPPQPTPSNLHSLRLVPCSHNRTLTYYYILLMPCPTSTLTYCYTLPYPALDPHAFPHPALPPTARPGQDTAAATIRGQPGSEITRNQDPHAGTLSNQDPGTRIHNQSHCPTRIPCHA